MKRIIVLLLLIVSHFSFSQEVKIRIADVGAGLGTVTLLPDGKVMVYDAGRYTRLIPTLKDMIPGGVIDLLVLSHNDADHIGGVVEIEKLFDVKTVIFSTYRGDDCENGARKMYCKAMDAIKRMEEKGTKLISITNTIPKSNYTLLEGGGAKVTYLCGFDDPYALWSFKKKDEPSKPRNAISLMVRLDYDGKSIIYGGDAVGKLEKSNACVYTEEYLLANVDRKLLNADVIISPHHGADNGDCDDFIKVVTPDYVIFSAGSEHGHPRKTTVQRYLENGVLASNMYRTDRGDDELRYAKKEWDEGRVKGCVDMPSDDDIEVTFKLSKEIIIEYVYPDRCFCKDITVGN